MSSLGSLEEAAKTHQRLLQSFDVQVSSTFLHDTIHEYKSKKSEMEWQKRGSKERVLGMERLLEMTKSEWGQVDQTQLDHEAHARYTKEQDKLQFNLQTESKQSELYYNNLIAEKETASEQLKEIQAAVNKVPPLAQEACILSLFHGIGIHFDPDLSDTDSLHIPVKSVYLRNPTSEVAFLYHIEPEDNLETIRDFFWANI